MATDPRQLAGDVLALCCAQGFALAGVCEARPSDFVEEFRAWLDAGRHGSMQWLANHAEVRTDPALLLDGARSIVLVADLYETRDGEPHEREDTPPTHGKVARYARGADYHKVMKKRLHALCDILREAHPGEQFRACVDTAPLMEREHAARAGLGWIGKHSLLIHPRLGSFMLLGAVVTTLPLDPPPSQAPVTDHCGSCTRCIDACPTGAITPRSVDASRCISYLTIERRLPIDKQFHEAMGQWAFGCDICQEICPHNSPRTNGQTGERHEAYTPRFASLPLLDLLRWSEEDRRRVLSGSSMKRATLAMFKRNAAIAAGNALRSGTLAPEDAAALLSRLRELVDDPDPGVCLAAEAALAQIDSSEPGNSP